MLSEKFATLILLAGIALLTGLASFLFGFFEGPQIAHYVNLSSLSLTTFIIYQMIKNLRKSGKEIFLQNWKIITVLILGISANILVSLKLIDFRYGYTNWEYKNILILEFPETIPSEN